jgi:hypothetical protein
MNRFNQKTGKKENLMSHKTICTSWYLLMLLAIIGMMSSTVTAQFAINAPAISPKQLDFGALHDGQSKKLTLSLTSPGAGNLQLELMNGLFHVTEYREVALGGGSKNAPMRSPSMGPIRVVKARIPNPTGPFQVEANSQIELDVVFRPVFPSEQFPSLPPGLQSATLKLNGPGIARPWAISVPLHGIFQGTQIQVQGFLAQARGGSYRITGDGFHPNEQIRLEVSNLPAKGSKKLLGVFTAGADGKFTYQYDATVDATPCTTVSPAASNTWQVTFTASGADSRVPATAVAFARGFLIYDCR